MIEIAEQMPLRMVAFSSSLKTVPDPGTGMVGMEDQKLPECFESVT